MPEERRKENRKWFLIITVFLAAFFGFTIWSKNQPVKETPTERESRLVRCAEVSGTVPTYSEVLDGDNAGVCKGFTQEDIDSVRQ